LINLGSTETARINEEFAASLSTQIQSLVDKGLFSGDAVTDVTARNTRDRDEQIQTLNDRLNREKLENEHTLYSQQVAMRTGTMQGKDRMHGVEQEMFRYRISQAEGLHALEQNMRDRTQVGKEKIYALKEANIRFQTDMRKLIHDTGNQIRKLVIDESARLQQLQFAIEQFKGGSRDQLLAQIQDNVKQHLAGLDRQHVLQQEVSRAEAQQRNIFHQQLDAAVKGFLTGKESFATVTTRTASTLAEHRHKMVVEKMNEYVAWLNARNQNHEGNMKLMSYQLDERNKLLIGLYGFVERREDVGPTIEDLAKICTSLGDAGGGWLTP
jgi:hypothetical protein